MPCIFCDQTPETVTAVATLLEIKSWLGLSPSASNDVIRAKIAHMQLDLSDAKYDVTRWRNRYEDAVEEANKLRELQTRHWRPEPLQRSAEEWERMTTPMTPMLVKPNGKAGRWALAEPYNCGKSKKDRFK